MTSWSIDPTPCLELATPVAPLRRRGRLMRYRGVVIIFPATYWAQGYCEGIFEERPMGAAQQYEVRLAAITGIRDAMRYIERNEGWEEAAKELVKQRVRQALPKPPPPPAKTPRQTPKTRPKR